MSKANTFDFLFLVEHEDRELHSVHRIAERIKELGATSLIISMEFFGALASTLKVKTIVVPYAISSKTWPLKYLLSVFPQVQIISLNWEQLLSEANKDFKRPRDEYIKKSVKHLAWSDTYKNFLIDSGVVGSNITVIGNPLTQSLLEFVNSENEIRLKLSKEFSLSVDKQTIFFPMNYGWAFYSDKAIETKIEQGYGKDVAYEYRAYSRRCLEQFCYFVRDVLRSGQFNIIVRPHPSISVEQYIDVLNQYTEGVVEKICITKEYTIKEWIAASDIVASSWSTSVWDAANVGKKVFLFTPYDRPLWLNTWWNDLVPNISSFGEISSVPHTNDDLAHIPAYLIIPEIASWLKEMSNDANFNCKSPAKVSIINMLYGYFSIYSIRCRFRLFCMKFLGGAFVRQGMKRDYFLPINISVD